MFSPFRAVLAGVIVATVVLLPALPAPAAAAATPATPACTAPRPHLTYTPESFTWGMTVDYTGCEWWDGGTIELLGSLVRLDGGQASTNTPTMRTCVYDDDGTAG